MKQWLSTWTKQSGVLLLLFSTLLFMCAPAYAERVDLLNSAGATAQGAGTAGKAALTGFNIPAGKRRALFIYAAFERDHCDKSTDVCTTSNTGTTGDLSDNFARETGSSTSSNLQITAAVTKGTTTIAKKNALVVGGAPSGSLGYNYAQLKLTPNNTVYFSIESYAIVLNEAEIQTLLGGAASGTVDISFPSIGLPKSTGDEMIVTAYVYNNVEQTVTGIHRVTSNMNTTARTSSMAGNSTITTSTFNTSDMPLGTNDRMLTIGISSMGGPTITGAGFLTHAYMTLIHNFLTNNNTGRFDTVFSNASSEPDGLSLTALDFNSWTSDTSFTFQLGGTSTNKVTAFGVDTYRIVAYNTDTSDGPSVDAYGRADHKPVAGGIRLGSLVDEDVRGMGYETNHNKTDDSDNLDDEDGITLPATIKPNTTINIIADIQGASGYASAWIDWNHDWDFDDSGETLVLDQPVNVGQQTLWVNVPSIIANGESTLRVRVCSTTNQCNTVTGSLEEEKHALSGEVEDHTVVFDNTIALPTVGSASGTATCSAAGGTDVLFVLDNSGSISGGEYTSFAQNVQSVGNALLANNSQVRIGVMHYGGLYFLKDFGQHIYIERDFSRNAVALPVRQFGQGSSLAKLTMDNLAGAIYQAAYTLDGNASTTNGYVMSSMREFSRDTTRPLQIVIFTDAKRYENMGTALIDGAGYGFEPDDGSEFTIFNKLKAQGIKFTVIQYPDSDATAVPAAAAIASKGGAYTGAVEANSKDPEGSGTTPRRVIEGSTTFTLTAAQITEIATSVGSTCIPPLNNAPVITSNGGGVTAAISIMENQTAVTTVKATDGDADPLTYSITGGADAAKFSINPTTGVLTFVTAPNFEMPSDNGANNIYDVRVQVSDGRGGIDTQDIAITVVQVITSLPPELSTQVCPANVNDLKTDDYRIAWTYNNPVNTLEPSFDPVPNGKYDETTFSSASTQVIGSGLTYNFDNNAQTIIRLAQVDRKSTATALAFGDYIEYSFTTQANVRKGQLINGLGFQIHNLGGSYKISVLVSKDNFATAKVLLNDYALAPLAASTWYKIATTTAMYIEPSTSYQLRIVFHSASDANAVFWDDLHLSLGLCRDFGDAPATYGDATHDIVANSTYYLGNAIPDAEGASLGSTDAQGDDTSGLRPDDEEAVTIPSTITSRSTNLVVKVKGAGGLLQAWLDWDKNGAFDTTDQIAKNLKDTDGDGLITVPLNVTKANSNLDSYARFRWNNWPDVDATTPVTDGEVEDYVVKIAIINSPPMITSNGGGDAATISLAESTSTTATTVTATDVDSDTLSYSITGGTDATLFTINTATGLLQLKSLPDYENPTDSNKDNAYVVQVQVQASDGNGGTDTQLITVNVTSVNEPPVITSNGGGATAAVSVVENQTAVTTVIATDPDKDTLNYSIIAGADATKFTINGTSGVLQFKTAPDYEASSDANNDNSYVVQVQASDGKGGFDSQTLTITVTDINDAPIITSNGGGDSAAVSVAENQTAVTTVTATDVDKDTLSFSISGGTDATLFTLNSVTGVLKFTTAPNFEIPTDSDGNNVYQVEVMVSDSKGGTDKQLLAVTVTNILETAAVRVRVFLQGSYDADMMLMRDDLRRANLIPLTQPYTIAPFKYQGTEQTTSTRLTTGGVAAVVDWVLIELRSTAQRSTVLARKAALLTRSGDVLDPLTDQTLLTFNDADNVNYYVAVLHRNHLGVMTTNAFNLAASNNVLVDFSLTSTAVYGGANARLASGAVNVLWAGDTNRSQLVIANGPDNDVVPILNAALINPANTLLNSNYLVYGYSSNDLDMNGYTLFAGPGNDLNMMVGNVLMHKDNRTSSANFVITGGLLAK